MVTGEPLLCLCVFLLWGSECVESTWLLLFISFCVIVTHIHRHTPKRKHTDTRTDTYHESDMHRKTDRLTQILRKTHYTHMFSHPYTDADTHTRYHTYEHRQTHNHTHPDTDTYRQTQADLRCITLSLPRPSSQVQGIEQTDTYTEIVTTVRDRQRERLCVTVCACVSESV